MLIIAATTNQGKIKEIKQMLPEYEIKSLKDLSFEGDIEENGISFSENAFIKAKAVYNTYHLAYPEAFILADDSGLEVEALGGRPGIFSARYAGPGSTQDELIHKVLKELESIPNTLRNARFYCVMAMLTPQMTPHQAEGICNGRITLEPKGTNGFGYDPIFAVEERNFESTMAELTDVEKNSLSHRRRALDGIKKILEEKLK
jgi:XTP/dITP diphosphohydrolase